MEFNENLFSKYPDFRDFLRSKSWKTSFTAPTLERSHVYASARYVRLISQLASSGGSFSFIATVNGTHPKPYDLLISFTRSKNGWTVASDCSCPVCYQCKHGAAVLSLISANLTEGNRPPPPPQLDAETQAWLASLEKANRESDDDAKPIAPTNKFLAYCIEGGTYSDSPLTLTLRIGTRGKSGVTLENGIAEADLIRLPKYLVEADIPLVAQYRRIEKRQKDSYRVKLTGPGWQEIIACALSQERLFFYQSAASYREKAHYRLLSEGPSEFAEATWQPLSNGSTKPVLRFDDPEICLIPTQPPLYLNLPAAVVGPVESDLPPAVVSQWTSGPAIFPRELALLHEKISAIPGKKPLPLPVELKEVLHPATSPAARLLICAESIDIGDFGYVRIIGVPTFTYGDSPALSPALRDEAPLHRQIIRGTRHVWPRNPKAELALIQTLIDSDLIPVSNRKFNDPLKVTLPTLGDDLQIWADFLTGPEAASLRDSGWTIDIDPKSGLTPHDATNLLTDIQADPDHGIDWFRFDMHFEIDGKKFSLIPVIAQTISENFPPSDSPDLPDTIVVPCENREDGYIRFPAKRLMEIVEQTCHLFQGYTSRKDGELRIDRLTAASIADSLFIDHSETTRALAELGRALKNITSLPPAEIPPSLCAQLRPYQEDGYRWLQFLATHRLNGILADDMGLGKTIQTLAHLAAEASKNPGHPSLVIAPTSVVPNWTDEAARFTPNLKIVTLQGKDRAENFDDIAQADVVLTSYPLISRDLEIFENQQWHLVVLDEAQYIKNPKAITAQAACKLKATHRLCLSGTPMENHLGELWSLMRFLMPGLLGDEKSFNTHLRRPIERDRSTDAQLSLNRRVAPLILRRTKDQVATDLPEKTTLIHHIDLTKKQTDLYESVRASMDKRVRDAIAAKGLGQSHIIVLDALLKLRQICCHPQLLHSAAAKKVTESAKLDYLVAELLPTLLEEGRRILLFSQFTSMLALIEEHLEISKIPFLKLTGQTQDRAALVKKFQSGDVPIFLISLKAGGTGLNLTAADAVIHYDPWWNPAAENQATDRAHRIGQTKPVFVHKLVCRGTIEERILDLQKHKAALVEALLSDETSRLKIDVETLSHLLSPLD